MNGICWGDGLTNSAEAKFWVKYMSWFDWPETTWRCYCFHLGFFCDILSPYHCKLITSVILFVSIKVFKLVTGFNFPNLKKWFASFSFCWRLTCSAQNTLGSYIINSQFSQVLKFVWIVWYVQRAGWLLISKISFTKNINDWCRQAHSWKSTVHSNTWRPLSEWCASDRDDPLLRIYNWM